MSILILLLIAIINFRMKDFDKLWYGKVIHHFDVEIIQLLIVIINLIMEDFEKL